MRFIDAFAPGMTDGTYELSAQLTIDAPGATVPPANQTIVVQGPRFSLPPADVSSMYPPPGSGGPFERVLPNIVLRERLLPWERACISMPAGTPWLALLALDPAEFVSDPSVSPPVTVASNYAQTTTVAELRAADPTAFRVPDITVGADESGVRCDVITIASSTFAAVMPIAPELLLLTHGRDVATAAKPVVDMTHDGQFSVVVANRFPPVREGQPTPCVVHLVSVEGFGDLLGGAAPVRPAQPAVKLISLAHWTFSCDPDAAQNFGGLAERLAFASDGTQRPATELMLRLPSASPTHDPSGPTEVNASEPAAPVGSPASIVARRLADGYVAAGYHARTGEDGFAWYRGPLTPTVQPPAGQTPGSFTTADAAVIFDPSTGLFDHRLAAAWQCGRSLALANQSFAERLTGMRRDVRRKLLSATAGGADLPGESADATAGLAGLFRDGVLERLGEASREAPPRAVPARRARRPSAGFGPRLRTMLADPAVIASLTAGDGPAAAGLASVGDWLAKLLLLEGVPFDHLVPDPRMLPEESIRFFYLDNAWVSAMLDGALSLGIATSEDAVVQAALSAAQIAAARAAAWSARAGALGEPLPLEFGGPNAGLLLRSSLVTGWPGMTVHATSGGVPVAPLRLDVLQPGVMFCLFDGVPDSVSFTEPHEGMAFGVNDLGAIVLRSPAGASTATSPTVEIYDPSAAAPTGGVAMRPGAERVLNLASAPGSEPPGDLLGLIAAGLETSADGIGSGSLALQMVKGPEQFTLVPPPSTPKKDSR